jgi:outer membrane protein assembly factor BamA
MVRLVPPALSVEGAILPGRVTPPGDVERFLGDYARGLPQPDAPPPAQQYKQGLILEAVGQPTVSAGFSSYGFQAVGSVGASFSDMLGDRLFLAAAQIGGSLADLGGQLAYVNRRHRWNWGVGINAIPFAYGYETLDRDPDGKLLIQASIRRQTSRGVTFMTARPFSSTTRVEFGMDVRRVTMTEERVTTRVSEDEVTRDRERFTVAGPFNLAEGRVALVHDTTYFGATGPLYGERYRVEFGKSVGSIDYFTVLADWRRYYMPKRPVTFGVRVLHYGRYGGDAAHENLMPAYLGYPELVRGYGIGTFSTNECQLAGGPHAAQCGVFENLLGSRMAVANFEVRAPLVGLFSRELRYGRVPVDVGAFFDAGFTWGELTQPVLVGRSHDIVRSAGAMARVNTFGWFIIEVSAARAFDRIDRNWQWQVGFRQGF